jgi:hypothetical protein
MIWRKQKRERRPRKRDVEALSEALNEIEACFKLLGFSADHDQEKQEDHNEDQEFNNEEVYGPAVYQREDLEVAIDVLISELVSDGLFPKPSRGTEPTLADVFERFFGEDDKIAQLAQEFDQYIEGYFGAIGYDDMNSAHGTILAIRNILRTEMKRHGEN